jgi:hypothetical protein
MMPLLNVTMKDGSRHFLSMPESYPGEPFRDQLAKLSGVEIKNFTTDQVTEVWIDFLYQGHSFTINNVLGEYWFFVTDPNCSDSTLIKIAEHASAFPR